MKAVYEKYLNGHSISDKELEAAIPFFKRVSDDLHLLGDRFRLAANEANRMYINLYEMQIARGRRKL